ncbi:MAG: hypothetical protein HY703_13095 [Gemmatimonadetes bacterium]|nr:hypothetical protein [Gemmatimonadota bacterium]
MADGQTRAVRLNRQRPDGTWQTAFADLHARHLLVLEKQSDGQIARTVLRGPAARSSDLGRALEHLAARALAACGAADH